MLTEEMVIQRIQEFFEDNYERLRLEGGHLLTEDVKKTALNQVFYYYKRMKELAERVTETEVKLSLPDLTTPKGREFTIEGVVDIVRQEKKIWMYDLKTADREFIKQNFEFYEEQLSIYAHIWQRLHSELLDQTAIIATALPNSLKDAIRAGDNKRIEYELSRWEPVIPIAVTQEKISKTIAQFGKAVDEIEDKNFKPAPEEKLHEIVAGTKTAFAVRVCRNCDARFSCSSFQKLAAEADKTGQFTMKKYFENHATDSDQEDWVNTNLEGTDFRKFEEKVK